MEEWLDGSKGRFKDCSQQSKIIYEIGRKITRNFVLQDDIVADYKKINTYDGPLRKSEPDIPETIPE